MSEPVHVSQKGRHFDIDLDLVYALAKIHCSDSEIAAIVGCDARTIKSRCRDIITRAREEGRMSLRRAMYHKAVNESNPVMQIFLAKNWLGMQNDPPAGNNDKILPWSDDEVVADQEEQYSIELTDDAQETLKG